MARVTGAQNTDASEIEERNCASNFGAEGWGDEYCGAVVWCAMSLLVSAASDARAPGTFGVPKERFSSWTLAGSLLFAPAHEKLKIHP
ncbi:hypothetical protein [Vibrio gazogenes]|uniref:hypothetical protein n=1 Tax=Vibrio gazogenes TaxID=687 RepID=UPI0012FD7942|nr:hypothetical protein [Vibrio gazogenes]